MGDNVTLREASARGRPWRKGHLLDFLVLPKGRHSANRLRTHCTRARANHASVRASAPPLSPSQWHLEGPLTR